MPEKKIEQLIHNMATKEQKQEEQKPRRINPIMEYLAPLRGTLIINDPSFL